jgi:hypothetical protein
MVFANAAGFVAFVTLVVVLLLRHNELPAATQWRIVGWGIVVAAGGLVGPGLRWLRSWVAVDDRRLAWCIGWLRLRRLEAPLADLRAFGVEQSWLGRLLGYGELRAVDAAGVEHVFGPVGELTAFHDAVARSGRRRGRRDG